MPNVIVLIFVGASLRGRPIDDSLGNKLQKPRRWGALEGTPLQIKTPVGHLAPAINMLLLRSKDITRVVNPQSMFRHEGASVPQQPFARRLLMRKL